MTPWLSRSPNGITSRCAACTPKASRLSPSPARSAAARHAPPAVPQATALDLCLVQRPDFLLARQRAVVKGHRLVARVPDLHTPRTGNRVDPAVRAQFADHRAQHHRAPARSRTVRLGRSLGSPPHPGHAEGRLRGATASLVCVDEATLVGDSVSEDPARTTQTLSLLQQAQAVSTDTKVRALHPDWDDTAVQAEVDRILTETGQSVPDPMQSGLLA